MLFLKALWMVLTTSLLWSCCRVLGRCHGTGLALLNWGGFFLKNVILQCIKRLTCGDGKDITSSLLCGVVVGSKYFLRMFHIVIMSA